MAQFDVYYNANSDTNEYFPYLLDIQAEILSDLSTRIIVPLAVSIKPIRHLNPVFEIEGNTFVMMTQELAGIASSVLGAYVCSVKDKRHDILSAVDFMITGF